MSKTIEFKGETKARINPDNVLKGAVGELGTVIVLGWDNDDNFYIASSIGEPADIIYMLEVAKSVTLEE